MKTSRGFLGAACWCSAWFAISSFLLHAEIRGIREREVDAKGRREKKDRYEEKVSERNGAVSRGRLRNMTGDWEAKHVFGSS